MKTVTYAAGQAPVVIDNRTADAWAAELVERSSKLCERRIVAFADEEEQRNAALGVGDKTAEEVAAHISACRTAHAARKAAIQAILDDGFLDDAAKLAALDAL